MKTKSPISFLASCLALIAMCGAAADAGAAADDAAASLLVPIVKVGRSIDTRVVITNHGASPVDLSISAVDGNSGLPTPFDCMLPSGGTVIDALSSVRIDVATGCNLPANPFDGALFITTRNPEIAHLSAATTLIVLDAARKPGVDASIAAVPFGALPGIATPQFVDDLESNTGGTGAQSDCTIVAGPSSGNSLVTGTLTLEGPGGRPLGSPIPLKVPPLAAITIPDVFGKAGAMGGFTAIRAALRITSADDVGLALACYVAVPRSSGQAAAFSLHPANTRDSDNSARQRDVTASLSPGSPTWSVTGSENDLHVVFLRHQDRIECSVRATSGAPSNLLRLTAVQPDRRGSLGGSGPDIRRVITGSKSSVNAGVSGGWGLIVEQALPDPSLTIPYTLSCRTGNGTAAPLLKAKSPKALPRP